MSEEPTTEYSSILADEEAASAAPATAGRIPISIPGVDLSTAEGPLLVVFVMSIILLIATGAQYGWEFDSSYPRYAISIAPITMILSFISLVIHHFANDLYPKVCKPVNGCLFLYCFIGACMLTFKGPFKSTSNGYFTAWIAAYASALAVGTDAEAFRTGIRGMGALIGLLTSSIVVVIACIEPIHAWSAGRNDAIYALSLALATIVFVAAISIMGNKGKNIPGVMHFGAMSVLAIMWIVSASLVTFDGPFFVTGNGYFASWAGAATSMYAAHASFQARREWG